MNIASLVEIKYVSHIFRNVYLYFLIFLASLLLHGSQPDITRFFVGIIVLVLSYTSVYFFNDYADHADDPKYGKRNLYLDIANKRLFWIVTTALLMFGVVASTLISTKAGILFGALIGSNLVYSFHPFRFRDVPFIRECTLFSIYFVKWLYLFELLNGEFGNPAPLTLFILGSSFAALICTFYKRHLGRNIFSEYFFGFVFLCACLVAFYQYPSLLVLFIPIIPMVIYLGIRYKNTQIPFGRYQFLHFFYLLAVYLYLSLKSLF